MESCVAGLNTTKTHTHKSAYAIDTKLYTERAKRDRVGIDHNLPVRRS